MRAHGSAAPASESATPYDPARSDGSGCSLPRLDPLGPWCSARLTFADGARIDVLVTVSDERLTVEDVRADPPLTLAALAGLARWIEGPLDDAFRAATGRPQKARPTPRRPGPAAVPAAGDEALPAGPDTEPADDAASRPMSGPRPPSSHQPVPPPQPVHGPLPERQPEPAGAGAGEGPAPSGTEAAAPVGAAGTVPGDGGAADATASGAGRRAETADGPSAELPADASADASAESPAEPPTPCASATPSASSAASTPGTSPASTAPPGAVPPAERTRSAVLARSRSGERRRIAADAYRQAQQEGSDPVLAVMLATGRNRRRSLRLIAGARDEGLLTPRHNKR
ncbi:hypothetical protein IPZ61_28100 [Streptomyces sioyaensis]|uniref:DUF6214 family protein n=1 Tax=Streptomyces sioyaensis TaxID=67364 RepID=UPI001F30583F|nr:DUF6214 family protein [Streptomyces sioyaensis]MCF3177166.1 hypothetical protein [Streptomyces sioyaensis]